jgi:hypothetical protein
MAHNCLNAWASKVASLKGKLNVHLTDRGLGWAKRTIMPVTQERLTLLRQDLEWALGYPDSGNAGHEGGNINAQNVHGDCDSVLSDLAAHGYDPSGGHVNGSNPPGQFGWLNEVEPSDPAVTEAYTLLSIVKDCLNPPGGGGGSGSGGSGGGGGGSGTGTGNQGGQNWNVVNVWSAMDELAERLRRLASTLEPRVDPRKLKEPKVPPRGTN